MAEVAEAVAKPREVETVTMQDGRKVEFVGKRKLLKETLIDDSKITIDGDGVYVGSGAVQVRLDFRNGETRTFAVSPALLAKSAGHGVEQKLGDETAGEDDVDDMVLSVDALMERLSTQGLDGWATKREAGGMAGTSVLLRALVEHSGKTVEQVKAFLADKTQAQKTALRNSDKLRPIVQRIEAEKAAKTAKVDTEALLGQLA